MIIKNYKIGNVKEVGTNKKVKSIKDLNTYLK